MKNGKLRSQTWFARQGREGFVHRAWLKAEGFTDSVFEDRPVIGIANSWSELNNCNSHLRQVAEAVKRGVLMAGGRALGFSGILFRGGHRKATAPIVPHLKGKDGEGGTPATPNGGVGPACGRG